MFLIMICITFLSACSRTSTTPETPRANRFEQPEPPVEYAIKVNPLALDDTAIQEGNAIYHANCVSCHGDKGMGDGPVADSLNPKPHALAVTKSKLSDGYLFWRISEGGLIAPFHSVMPTWKSTFSEEEIWQIIAYLRTL